MDQLNDANPLEKRLVNKANEARIPITANFELTPTCNLHCDMCFIRMEHNAVQAMGGVRTLEDWLDTARQLKEMGTLFMARTIDTMLCHGRTGRHFERNHRSRSMETNSNY